MDLNTNIIYLGGPQQQGLHRGRLARVMQTGAGTCESNFVRLVDELLEDKKDTMLPAILESVGLAWVRSAHVLECGLLMTKRTNNMKKNKMQQKKLVKKEVRVVRASERKSDNNNKIVLHKSSPKVKKEDSSTPAVHKR